MAPALVRVEILDGGQLLRGVVPQIFQGLAHMGEVLLLDMGIIVLTVWSGAGELELLLLGVSISELIRFSYVRARNLEKRSGRRRGRSEGPESGEESCEATSNSPVISGRGFLDPG